MRNTSWRQSRAGSSRGRPESPVCPPPQPSPHMPQLLPLLCNPLSGSLTLPLPWWVESPHLGTQKTQNYLQQVPCPPQIRHTGLAAHTNPGSICLLHTEKGWHLRAWILGAAGLREHSLGSIEAQLCPTGLRGRLGVEQAQLARRSWAADGSGSKPGPQRGTEVRTVCG